MSHCPSPQEIFTAAILRQKWIDSVAAEVEEVYERISSGKNFEIEFQNLQKFLIERTSLQTQKRTHFKDQSSMLRALEDALKRSRAIATTPEGEAMFNHLTSTLKPTTSSPNNKTETRPGGL